MDDPLQALIDRLDSKSAFQQEEAWLVIRPHGAALMHGFKNAYARFRKSEGRVALVFYATSFARVSEDAFALGVAALNDRSKIVRNRACGLLAYSLRADALGPLHDAARDSDESVRQSAKAATTAIKARNHHLFVDRICSGTTFWVVNPGDDPRL
jgi:hypothetical protein